MTNPTTVPRVVQLTTAATGPGKRDRIIALADDGRLYELARISGGGEEWTALPALPVGELLTDRVAG